MSRLSSVLSPVTSASAAYISEYQLTWLSRIVGQRQNFPRVVRWIAVRMPSTVEAGSSSSRRARYAYTRPSTTSASNTRCWNPRPLMEFTHPGAWIWPTAGLVTYGPPGWTSRAASARALASLRDGPVQPFIAATEWVNSSIEFAIGSTPPPPSR
jgi:hypothetical protein